MSRLALFAFIPIVFISLVIMLCILASTKTLNVGTWPSHKKRICGFCYVTAIIALSALLLGLV